MRSVTSKRAHWKGLTTSAVVNSPSIATAAVTFAPDAAFVVDPRRLYHRNPVTPYADRPLAGVVRRTWLRGEPVSDEPRGRLISRGEA